MGYLPFPILEERWLPHLGQVRGQDNHDLHKVRDAICCRRRVGERTLELHTYYLGLALPELARIEAARVMPGQIGSVVHRIGRDSGAATANKARRVLFGLFRYAVRQRYFVHNPVASVDLLKETPQEITIWLHDEASRFMSVVLTHRLYALFHLAIETGLRKGEIQALRWSDIWGGKAVVTRTVTRVRGDLRFSPPKTRNGRRVVALAPESLGALAEHRKRQEVERAMATAPFNELGYVICDVEGNIITPMALHHVFRRLQKAAGVPTVRFHDLRHLNVSLLIEHGVSPEVIADRVGHRDGAYTLARYTHVCETSRPNAAVGLSALLGTRAPVN